MKSKEGNFTALVCFTTVVAQSTGLDNAGRGERQRGICYVSKSNSYKAGSLGGEYFFWSGNMSEMLRRGTVVGS